ncbi:MAG TPA: hypothetical protein VHC90_20850 [Bryobacteraceae bacterium]|nr:hypothetical protein [Bryobacteraceae bacterium]
MRRLLASLLLVVISLSLVSPVLASTAKSDLPACCLRNGKHHCTMGAPEISTHGSPGLRTDCPFRNHGSLVAASGQKLLAAPRTGFRFATLPAVVLESAPEVQPNLRQITAHNKRGPPSHFT